MTTSEKGIELIKRFESLHDGDLSLVGLQPKMCPAGIWTEGYGHAMRLNGQFIKGPENKSLAYRLQTIKSEADAIKVLKDDLADFEDHLKKIVNATLTQNQFDALVSLCYNIGPLNMQSSTIIKKVNANPADPSIRREFEKWIYASGRVLPGLVKRRNAEANLYFS